MGALPGGVRANAVEMPGTGAKPGRAQEVPFQEQADEPGWEHHRPVGEHVRLGQIPADQGRHQTAPAAGPRWLLAVVRGGDRARARPARSTWRARCGSRRAPSWRSTAATLTTYGFGN